VPLTTRVHTHYDTRVAAGDYAYCTVIKALDQKNPRYRVLALSATPGTDILKVQSVLQALHISHIEVCGPS
jgi:ATP-dependent DNA helicase MPH1